MQQKIRFDISWPFWYGSWLTCFWINWTQLAPIETLWWLNCRHLIGPCLCFAWGIGGEAVESCDLAVHHNEFSAHPFVAVCCFIFCDYFRRLFLSWNLLRFCHCRFFWRPHQFSVLGSPSPSILCRRVSAMRFLNNVCFNLLLLCVNDDGVCMFVTSGFNLNAGSPSPIITPNHL